MWKCVALRVFIFSFKFLIVLIQFTTLKFFGLYYEYPNFFLKLNAYNLIKHNTPPQIYLVFCAIYCHKLHILFHIIYVLYHKDILTHFIQLCLYVLLINSSCQKTLTSSQLKYFFNSSCTSITSAQFRHPMIFLIFSIQYLQFTVMPSSEMNCTISVFHNLQSLVGYILHCLFDEDSYEGLIQLKHFQIFQPLFVLVHGNFFSAPLE